MNRDEYIQNAFEQFIHDDVWPVLQAEGQRMIDQAKNELLAITAATQEERLMKISNALHKAQDYKQFWDELQQFILNTARK
jgi:hypothetical protein